MESIEGSLLGGGVGMIGNDVLTGTLLSNTDLDGNTDFRAAFGAIRAAVGGRLLTSRDDLEFVSTDDFTSTSGPFTRFS